MCPLVDRFSIFATIEEDGMFILNFEILHVGDLVLNLLFFPFVCLVDYFFMVII